jgi:hypothetical protein
MKTKKVLFIDDDNVDEQIESIARRIKQKGFELQADILNPVEKPLQAMNHKTGNLETDFEKLKEKLTTSYFPTRYDVVACDFSFSKDPLNGYEVLKWMIRETKSSGYPIRKALFISYSSEEEKLVKNIVDNQELIQLIKLKIHDFYSRERLSVELSRMLVREDQTLNLTDFIRDELEKHGELTFKNVYPKFDSKTLGEIAVEVEKDSYHGVKFQKYMIELTIAHILELNQARQ